MQNTAVIAAPNLEAARDAGHELGVEIRSHIGKYGAFLVGHPEAMALFYRPYRLLKSKAEKNAFREAFLAQVES